MVYETADWLESNGVKMTPTCLKTGAVLDFGVRPIQANTSRLAYMHHCYIFPSKLGWD